ncbi:MAG: spore coat protein [Bacillota bacterium]
MIPITVKVKTSPGSFFFHLCLSRGQHNQKLNRTRTPGRLSDRTIATGALIAHKCGAVSAGRGALETADPDLRQFLTQAAVSDSNMAYEIFHWMNRKGFYQVPVMDQNTMQHMQHIYSPTTAPGGSMVGPQGPFV